MREQAAASQSVRLNFRPMAESILLGSIAVLIVQLFRAGFHRSIPWLIVEALVYLVIPVLVFGLMLRKHQLGDAVGETGLKYRLQLGAIAFALLPVLVQVVLRAVGLGDATEIVFLMVVQNAAWYLTVLAAFGNFRRAGFMMSSLLVLFVCLTTNDWSIYALSLSFSLVAMWWLMGHYWGRLETKVLDGHSRTLPVRWSFLAISAIAVGFVGLIAANSEPVMNAVAATGFMPTSGGDRWSDPYARAGMGDGDMLAAGENATTTGAVESDQFIEDNRPSIYDAINDMFDEPTPKLLKRKNRAVTLEEKAKHLHNVKQSEQSGRSFRVVRKPGRAPKPREFDDVIADAMFFVEGSVPVRFKTTTFNHFDGWDWTNKDVPWDDQMKRRLFVQKIRSKPWFVVQKQVRRFLTDARFHRVKIMNLESQALPSPSFLKRWHIFKVEAAHMFSWGDRDIAQFNGEIPRQTMIDMVSEVPNYHELRASNNFTNSFTGDSNGFFDWLDRKLGVVHHMHMSQGSEFQTERDSDSQFYQVPDDGTKLRLRELADQWTDGIEPGWNQVEAIVQQFRNEYSVDPENVPGEDCLNAVEHFLDQKSGPSYLFATTAAQMLRAAGYQTRIATGFLVGEKDYSRIARQSVVTSENVHLWPEVCLEGCHWIPLEPTPGIEVPFSTETLVQFARRKLNEAVAWAFAHPIISVSTFVALAVTYWYRTELIAAVWWIVWWLVFQFSSKRRLKITRQLIDARFRAAGYPRPPSALVTQWFRQVDQSAGKYFFQFWQTANFSNRPNDLPKVAVADACRQLVSELPLQKIIQYKKQLEF